jgi:hypothetical protein
MKMIWLFPTSFSCQTSRGAGRLRLMNRSGVREAPHRRRFAPLPPGEGRGEGKLQFGSSKPPLTLKRRSLAESLR